MIDYTYMDNVRARIGLRKEAIGKACGIPTDRVGEILRGKNNPRVEDLEAVLNELGLMLIIQPKD